MTDYLHLEIGESAPRIIAIVIETPHDGSNKCGYDKKRRRFKLDRILYSTGHFPTDDNFIPQRGRDDRNPWDSLRLGKLLTLPDCVYDAPPIGPFAMIDPGTPNKNLCTCRGKSPAAAQQNTRRHAHIF
jgi:inorganic pyrophosphatase